MALRVLNPRQVGTLAALPPPFSGLEGPLGSCAPVAPKDVEMVYLTDVEPGPDAAD